LNASASIDYFGGARDVIGLKGQALRILNGFRRDDIEGSLAGALGAGCVLRAELAPLLGSNGTGIAILGLGKTRSRQGQAQQQGSGWNNFGNHEINVSTLTIKS